MSHPNPHHTPNNLPQDGVVAASTASDAHGSQHPPYRFAGDTSAAKTAGPLVRGAQQSRITSDPANSDGGGSAPLPVTTTQACHDAFRDALRDLVNQDGTSSINPTNKKCPYGIALERNGYAAWANAVPPALGKWTITAAGWAFLETRTTRPEETR